MNDLEKMRNWLESYPGAAQMETMSIDYTDSLPGCFGVFPAGLVEISRTENIMGEATIENQYNFALYIVFQKSPGDDVEAKVNADWVMDFQRWVQQQSTSHIAPTFGNVDQLKEKMSAQNGALYQADEEGLAMYMVSLQATFKVKE